MPSGPLEGVRVVDLTHYMAGPFCTKLLADFGADVIKIEQPSGGDPTRHMGPFHGDDPHPEKSALFLHLNTNKRSVTLNLQAEAGKRVFQRLLEKADILVESFRPGVVADLGFDYATLEAEHPHLVMTSISNFGQTGPYRDLKGSDLTLFAMGGSMNINGSAEREPLKMAGNVISYHAGATAAYATLLALYEAELSGQGDHLDISIYESQAGSRDRRVTVLTAYQYAGEVASRASPGGRLGSGVRPCADGYVNILGGARWFSNLCSMIGHEELMEDPRFATQQARMEPGASEEFDAYYIPWLMERTKREIWEKAQEHHILSAIVNTTEDLVMDPSYQQRGVWETVDHPFTGPVTYPGRPFIMSKTPMSPARRAPLLGEHNQEVLCGELGYSQEDLVLLRQQGVI